MKTITRYWIGALLLGAGLNTAVAAQPVRAEVGKPLQEAQSLLQAKKPREALAQVALAAKVESLNAHERYLIERVRAGAATAAGDYTTAVRAYEAALSSPEFPAAERLAVLEGVARLAYSGKQYDKASSAISDYRAAGGDSVETLRLLPQALYLAERNAEAAKELDAQIAAIEKAGRAPTETQLQLLGSIALKQKDDAAYLRALEKLVTYHPKDSYWLDLILRTANRPDFSDRLSLDLYRLRLKTATLSKAADYVEATQLALQAGFPGEAEQFLKAGFERGVLGTGTPTDIDRHRRLADLVAQRVEADRQTLAEGEAAAAAKEDGDALVATGLNLVGHGQVERGIQLIEQGLAKGGLKQEPVAKLHLGYAYLRAGRSQDALRVFRTVRGPDGATELGKLWAAQARNT